MFQSPIKFLRGLETLPVAFAKGMCPDLALVRDIPGRLVQMPTWGREAQVLSAMLAKIDSLNAHGKKVSAVINTGDLVKDGRLPKHWERFLRLTRPLSSRVPYFAVAGNHERTDTVDGRENWRTATGLPVGGDRLYYCFDTADGWVRFIALDTNPIVDPGSLWSREVQIKYSKEEFDWLVARVKEHTGPVIVMMHHPPFSAGYHRVEWQRDSVLVERRETMVRALHDAGIAVILSGHEHAYQRALMTWPDAVLIAIVTGGAGAPLNTLPLPVESARLFSEYRVAGGGIRPENVFTAVTFNFIHMRLWFGGGEFTTYAVDALSKATQIDKVSIDLKRYGIPKIDQHKIPIPPAKGPKAPKESEGKMKAAVAKPDTAAASRRILQSPSPAKTKPKKTARPRATTPKTSATP
jgi:predicted MPP superfamily phosphohydrolase